MNDQSQQQTYGQNPPFQTQQPPVYGQPQHEGPNYMPPSPKKRGIFSKKRTWIFIATLIIVIGIIASANKGASTSSTTTSSSATSNSSTSKSAATNSSTQAGPSKVGDSIAVNDVACTLISAKPLAADDYIKPKPGNQFIVVHVKLVNKGSDESSYNEFDFHAKSGSGNITNMEAPPTTYTANNQLNSGQLAAGGTVEGDIIFQVPVSDHKAQLTWKPSIFGNSTDYAWNLGL